MKDTRGLLARYGLLGFKDATDGDIAAVERVRAGRGCAPVDWGMLRRQVRDHPVIGEYLYASTGWDGVLLLDVRTGRMLNARPLLCGMADLAEKPLAAWRGLPSLDHLAETDPEGLRRAVEHAVNTADRAYLELMYDLVPWGRADTPGLQRWAALTVRKMEDYPSARFDRRLEPLLRRTVPAAPLESPVGDVGMVWRGEIDGSTHLGLSWTADRRVAERFATRAGRAGRVFALRPAPGQVLAVYADDPEREVLVAGVTDAQARTV